MNYETVIGLEVHVELATKSKIFCGCTTVFGGEPNTHVCPVCLGMPGSLPTINKQAVEYALRAGIATNCIISGTSVFDRKNYFYPDLPKAYQISQLYYPLCRDGYLDIEVNGCSKRIGIHEIHMEEDAGKLIHDPWDDCSFIDYNRCGVPLIEIVSEPDFRSADEVLSYLEKLRETLLFLEVSDCKMQEGSMRADVNLSVRPAGSQTFGVRTEMKNMNSFKAIHKAIVYESSRQIDVLSSGGSVIQETRRWDDNKDASFAMRSKENAEEYRYFPEPDLPPLNIDNDWLDEIKNSLPETADSKRTRYENNFNLSNYDARLLTSEKQISYLFECVNTLTGNPKETANMITGEIMRLMKETATLPEDLNIPPEKPARLIKLLSDGAINRTTVKLVLEEIFINGVDPDVYIREHNLTIISDGNLINDTVAKVLDDNPKSVADYLSGTEKAFGFLVGQAMKALKGKANPQIVNQALKERLSSYDDSGDEDI